MRKALRVNTNKKYVYLIEFFGFHKIGVSNDPFRRFKDLETAFPVDGELLAFGHFEDAYDAERRFHKVLKDSRVKGEWFKLSNEKVLFVAKKMEYLLNETLEAKIKSLY